MPSRGISECLNLPTSRSRLVPTKCEVVWLRGWPSHRLARPTMRGAFQRCVSGRNNAMNMYRTIVYATVSVIAASLAFGSAFAQAPPPDFESMPVWSSRDGQLEFRDHGLVERADTGLRAPSKQRSGYSPLQNILIDSPFSHEHSDE